MASETGTDEKTEGIERGGGTGMGPDAGEAVLVEARVAPPCNSSHIPESKTLNGFAEAELAEERFFCGIRMVGGGCQNYNLGFFQENVVFKRQKSDT
jgi:hypothetical protein